MRKPRPARARSGDRPRGWFRRHKLATTLVLLLLAMIAALLAFTDSAPLIEPSPPPTAEQVGAARAAVRQFRLGQEGTGNTVVRFDEMQLAAAGTLASNGFRPHRLLAEARGGTVNLVGSYRLPLGRWLNAAVVTSGGGTGFPPIYLTIGSISFSQGLSRLIFEGARRVAIARGATLPSLDRLVRRVVVRKGVVSAIISLPPGSGMLSQLGGDTGRPDAILVRDAYCRLAKLQRAEPSDDIAIHVRRAFAAVPGTTATAQSNRAAFLALAMLTVDPRVGELAGLVHNATARCQLPPIATLLNARADLPKHWALSAALAAATGTQFSQAMGEWKELADSISRQSQFAVGDPSGFSFLDLAADRSGFLIAGLAVDPDSAGRLAGLLAAVEQHDLLPPALMGLEEGMPNAAFVRKYGDTRDPRFLAALARIDAELRRSAVERSGPLAALPQP